MDNLLSASSGNEWRLLHAVLLNALVLVAAYRFVRRRVTEDALAAMPQVLLFWFLVQYLSVALPGVVGILNRWTLSAVAVVTSALLLPPRRPSENHFPPPQSLPGTFLDRTIFWVCVVFFFGYLGAILSNQRLTPVVSDDALTYHLPAAVRWLQTGQLVLHDVWYFNPANSYSPLAGSIFAAWWMAPLGNDYLARFMQMPALVLIFFAMLQLARVLGAPLYVAAPVAVATALSRPFVSQVIVAKDDLFLSGFFLMAVLAASPGMLKERLGPWRLGVTVGLFLATKITALLALPLLVLLIDAPFRAGWRWRQWVIGAGVVGVLAGPWFARNWWLTGNPLYPTEVTVAGWTVWPGMFRAERSLELRTLGGVWRIITGSYFGIPVAVLAGLVLSWGVGVALAGRSILRDPVLRASLLGPALGVGIFAVAAPFPEVRFLDPSFLLLFAGMAVVAAGWRGRPLVWWGVVLVVAGVSVATGFVGEKAGGFALVGMVVAAPVPAVVYLGQRWPRGVQQLLGGCAAVAAVVLAMGIYVYQDALIREYAQATEIAWEMQYPGMAPVWAFVRGKVPVDKTLAYVDTYLTYPLFGFEGQRRVVYAPVRAGVRHLHDLPRLGRAIPGERLREAIKEATQDQADRKVWRANLEGMGVEYLVLGKKGEGERPVEMGWSEGEGFVKVFENEGGVVYRVGRGSWRPRISTN